MNLKKTVILIGGTGFVGRHIAALLVTNHYSVVVPTRSVATTRALSLLPGVRLVETDIHNEVQLKKLMGAVPHCVAVINLVGVLHDQPASPYGKSFSKNHVELPAKIVNVMKSLGLRRLIHMSALGADVNGPSMYQRSKGVGETFVQTSGLDWTIFRPSVIFGEDDSFINLFKKLLKVFPVMPLAGYGAKFQPVSVKNVAQVFVAALTKQETVGHVYEIGGPKIYQLSELVQFAGCLINKSPWVFPLPNPLGYAQAFLIEKMPGPTLMSRDNVSSMQVDNVLSNQGNAIKDVFGFDLEPLESLRN